MNDYLEETPAWPEWAARELHHDGRFVFEVRETRIDNLTIEHLIGKRGAQISVYQPYEHVTPTSRSSGYHKLFTRTFPCISWREADKRAKHFFLLENMIRYSLRHAMSSKDFQPTPSLVANDIYQDIVKETAK